MTIGQITAKCTFAHNKLCDAWAWQNVKRLTELCQSYIDALNLFEKFGYENPLKCELLNAQRYLDAFSTILAIEPPQEIINKSIADRFVELVFEEKTSSAQWKSDMSALALEASELGLQLYYKGKRLQSKITIGDTEGWTVYVLNTEHPYGTWCRFGCVDNAVDWLAKKLSE